jgi:hypothetical protein
MKTLAHFLLIHLHHSAPKKLAQRRLNDDNNDNIDNTDNIDNIDNTKGEVLTKYEEGEKGGP